MIWPQTATPVSPEAQVLSKRLVARPLPMSNLPSSPDFVSGSYTGRLGDAGEATFLFPNAIASDGFPWRRRFDPAGHLQFLEIYRNRELEFAGVIDAVTADQQQVTVHCQDGWFLLKKAYERDWIVVCSPRDVIERATQVWVPTTADSFPAGSLNAQWTVFTQAGGTVGLGATGGLNLAVPASSASAAAQVTASGGTLGGATGAWRATCQVAYSGITTVNYLSLGITESSGDLYVILLGLGYAEFDASISGATVAKTAIPSAATYSLMLESDGEWVWAFANGQLIGCMRRITATTTSLQTFIELQQPNPPGAAAGRAIVNGVLVEALQPFLQHGTDKGDYVLPGSASTYPSGGLHARYYNDTDLQSDANAPAKVLAPSRSQAYAGSGTAEYANQQDPTVNGQQNPTPGAATGFWSAKWFGAIWLPLSLGNFTFSFTLPANGSARVWIGKTRFGDQLLDQWPGSPGTYTFTVTAASLAGSLPYGAGTRARDGWYPIRIEYGVDGVGATAPILNFYTTPATYTDPGGTVCPQRTTTTGLVPATSLSPLGCVDQRYQGIAHFDLAQQTVAGFGYQASVEPQQLESGLFPGVLAPRIREGHDTDIILAPDTGPRTDGEGLLNYSATLDATDFAASIQGNGAGIQNGSTGQLQTEVYDPATLAASLFDVQGWQDFSDASFPSLLQALLNSALGLRLTPWQLLSADPTGSDRLAFTWPLPGALQAMRWRPGDGLRVQAREIGVWDTSPRQLLVITRTITPNGKTGATASWANRPRGAARALKQLLFAATRPQRNYQRQLVTLTGAFVTGVVAAGATGALSLVIPAATDTIVKARLRISANTGPVPFNVLVNGVDQTTTLTAGATITTVPVNLDLGPGAAPDANGQLYAAVKVPGGVGSTFNYQLLVDVLR